MVEPCIKNGWIWDGDYEGFRLSDVRQFNIQEDTGCGHWHFVFESYDYDELDDDQASNVIHVLAFETESAAEEFLLKVLDVTPTPEEVFESRRKMQGLVK